MDCMRTRFIRVAWKDDVFAGCGPVSGELETEVLASVVNTSWFVRDDPSATSGLQLLKIHTTFICNGYHSCQISYVQVTCAD